MAFVNLNCIMASFGWQLNYILTKISLKFEGSDVQIVSLLLLILTSYMAWERFIFFNNDVTAEFQLEGQVL